jgi:hypothetical protein
MGVIFNSKSLSNFSLPVLAQEFYNHNSTIFKVFVIGDWFQVVKRKSLPNLKMNSGTKDISLSTSNILAFEPVYFDSQDSNFGAKLAAVREDSELTDEELVSRATEPPHEVVKSLVQGIRKHMGLSLFGFDMVTEKETGFHAVIDVNYFPGRDFED